jgi:hypothetical protein
VIPAQVLLANLRGRGIELRGAGDRLRFRPADALTAEDLELLRLHKAELLALLAERAEGAGPVNGTPEPGPESGPAACLETSDQPLGMSPRIQGSRAFLWPDRLPLLGPRHVISFSPCCRCGWGSWVAYGETALCLACVLKAETAEDAGQARPSEAEAFMLEGNSG